MTTVPPPVDLPPDLIERLAVALARVIVASIRRDEAAAGAQELHVTASTNRRAG